MNSFSVEELQDNTLFTNDVCLDDNFILLNSTIPFTAKLKNFLKEWGFDTVYSDGKITQKFKAGEADTSKFKNVKFEQVSASEFGIEEPKEKPAQTAKKDDPDSLAARIKNAIDKAIEEPSQSELQKRAQNKNSFQAQKPIQSQNKTQITKSSQPKVAAKTQSKDSKDSSASEKIEEMLDKAENTEKSRLAFVRSIYDEYSEYITEIYTHYATHKKLNYTDISETVKSLILFIKDNRRYVLRIIPASDINDNKDIIVCHSMRSTVIAIVIGLYIRMPLYRLIDLGVTCILHEIGQILLPPQLYMIGRKLTSQERIKLATHPILGYNIVKENNFPLSVQLGILEHHERENGTGYPRHLDGVKISLYAKIIAVACTFEAITAPRQYKAAKSSFDAMIEILKNEDKAYDDTIVKALLCCLSLYPIGAYVYLSNGKIAQVTDVNPNNPRNPIVQIVGETDSAGEPKTVQTDMQRNKVVRVLNKKEASDILKHLDNSTTA